MLGSRLGLSQIECPANQGLRVGRCHEFGEETDTPKQKPHLKTRKRRASPQKKAPQRSSPLRWIGGGRVGNKPTSTPPTPTPVFFCKMPGACLQHGWGVASSASAAPPPPPPAPGPLFHHARPSPLSARTRRGWRREVCPQTAMDTSLRKRPHVESAGHCLPFCLPCPPHRAFLQRPHAPPPSK